MVPLELRRERENAAHLGKRRTASTDLREQMHWKAVKHYWALKFNDHTDLDGRLVGVYYDVGYQKPRAQALTTALFDTRDAARQFVRDRFNRDRGGLPVPTKVTVRFESE